MVNLQLFRLCLDLSTFIKNSSTQLTCGKCKITLHILIIDKTNLKLRFTFFAMPHRYTFKLYFAIIKYICIYY